VSHQSRAEAIWSGFMLERLPVQRQLRQPFIDRTVRVALSGGLMRRASYLLMLIAFHFAIMPASSHAKKVFTASSCAGTRGSTQGRRFLRQ
jgi:hypothetical protein